MRIFGTYVFSRRSLADRDRKMSQANVSSGFRDAVESLVKILESKDRIVLGNGVAFIGVKIQDPVTMIGNGQMIVNSHIGFFKKGHDKYRPVVKILPKL